VLQMSVLMLTSEGDSSLVIGTGWVTLCSYQTCDRAHSQGTWSVGGQSAGIYAGLSFGSAQLNSLPLTLYWDMVHHRKIGVAGCRKTRSEKKFAA
jgi:hypothetical protein